MRNSRTEDIVRHLYLAVNERDYWIRLNSGDIGELDRSGRLRLDQQLVYIYSKLKSWFKPIGEYTGSFTFDNSESVFIDDTVTPQNPVNDPDELFYFGYDSYDYSASGNLEALVGEDLSFIRNYGNYSFRILLEDLHIVYKLLNLDLRNRLFKYSRSGSEYNVIQFTNTDDQSMALGFKNGNDNDGGGQKPNSSIANTAFYNQTTIDYSNFISNKYRGFWNVVFTSQSYSVTQAKHGIRFNPTGFDSNDYNISDFNFKSFSYGFLKNGSFDDDFGIFPVEAYTVGHEIIENKFVDVPASLTVNWGGVHGFMHQDFVESDLPTVTASSSFQRSQQSSSAIPFINLNIEGFLNYYTEPTN